MTHLDDADLALAALGEPMPEEAAAHVAECARCRTELQSFTQVAHLAPATEDVEFVEAPPEVWQAITREQSREAAHTPAGEGGAVGTARAPRRPPVRWLGLAAAVVAGLVLGIGGVLAFTAVEEGGAQVASANLQPLPAEPAATASGYARVVRKNGAEYLSVQTSSLATPTGYYEAWLLNPASGEMIAVGTLPGDSGEVRLPLPAGVDISAYSAVDISDEPWDGDPVHSKVSVLRGTLVT